MKKEITLIIANIVSLLLAIFIVAYTFATIKDIRSTSISDAILYIGITVIIHQLLMRVQSLHTFVSDVVCMLTNLGFAMIGGIGAVVSGVLLLEEWMFKTVDQDVLILFVVCLTFLFYITRLLPEKFKPSKEDYG